MKISETIGVDVSKKVIDVEIHTSRIHEQFENNEKGFKRMGNWLKNNTFYSKENLLFALEHTGLYSNNLIVFLAVNDYKYKVLPGLEIKRSMGITRGKNDKIDAGRIALYAYEKRERLIPDTQCPEKLVDLRRLLSLRERLVKQRAGYKASYKEQSEILSKKKNRTLLKVQKNMIKCLSGEIEVIEKEMEEIVFGDTELKEQYNLITSIKGVGQQTALFIIVYTEGFRRFDTWRQFASYCGTAPFPNSSGSSIRGRTKVSNLANKKIKSLLDLCAKSAIQHNPELRNYYHKRIDAGKEKMSTINIIRNKLISRIFAVIKRRAPYVDLMRYAA